MRVSVTVPLVIVAASTIALGSCQTTLEQQADTGDNICSPQNNAPVESVVNFAGVEIPGGVTNVPGYEQQAWSTAVFVSAASSFSHLYQCGTRRINSFLTEPIMCEQSIDLDDIRGLARVPTGLANAMGVAERLAEQNCEEAATRFADRLSADFDRSCVMLATATCSFVVTRLAVTTVTGHIVGGAGN